MSDAVTVALIMVVPGVLSSVLGLVNKFAADRQKIASDSLHAKVQDVQDSVATVKSEINGQMAKLLQVTGEAERAKGVIEGHDAARSDQSIIQANKE
jgi:hypothetical protein